MRGTGCGSGLKNTMRYLVVLRARPSYSLSVTLVVTYTAFLDMLLGGAGFPAAPHWRVGSGVRRQSFFSRLHPMPARLGGIEKEHHDALPRGNPRDATPGRRPKYRVQYQSARLWLVAAVSNLFLKVFITLLLKDLMSSLMFSKKDLVGYSISPLSPTLSPHL
jgi:hypothetical protein